MSVGACVTLYVVFTSVLMCAISTLPLSASLDVTSSFLPYKHPLHVQSTFAPFPQDGWTAVLLAAHYGHKEVVQELCETFEADFLHRKKVRAMRIISRDEWLSKLCMFRFITCGYTNWMTVRQP